MDQELLYLKKRANFHRRMASRAMCEESRCAHEAFVRAYVERIENWPGRKGSRSEQGSPRQPDTLIYSIPAAHSPV